MSSPRSMSTAASGFESKTQHANMGYWRTSQTHSQSPPTLLAAPGQEQHQRQGQEQHQRAKSSVSQFPPILPPIPRVASKLDSSTSNSQSRSTFATETRQEPAYPSPDDEERGHDFSHINSHDHIHGRAQSPNDEATRMSFDRSSQPQFLQSATAATTTSLSPVLSSSSPSSDVLPRPASQAYAQAPTRLFRRSVTSPDGAFFSKATSPRDSPSPGSAGSANLPNSASSGTLGVPYRDVVARERPRSGNMPLPATGTINGVPQHHSRMSEQRPDLPPPAKSKTRLHMLNPVNLLMRRRSHQAADTVSDKASAKNLIVPPMDLPDGYDPRIKGNKVHDFSAPRPTRNLSYNDAVGSSSPPRLDVKFEASSLGPIQQSPPNLSREGSDEWAHQTRRSSQHTPVFTENFDSPTDDRQTSAIHAETLANTDFVARNSWQGGQQVPLPSLSSLSSLPPFGRKSQQMDEQHVHAAFNNTTRFSDPASISSHSDVSQTDSARGLGLRLSDPSPASPDTAPTIHSRPISKELPMIEESNRPVLQQSSSPPISSQRTTPSSLRGQSPSLEEGSSRRSSALKHLPSTASRFSFQIAGLDSMAEEKILEDKHKQRNSTQKMQPVDLSDEEEDESDLFDEDAMYDHDEMEGFDEPEVLGGNNVFQRTHDGGAAGFHFSDMRSSLPMTASPPVSPQPHETSFPTTPARDTQDSKSTSLVEQTARSPPFQLASADMPIKPTSPMSTNSFYFDDGMIDPLVDFDASPVDRDGNVFDEEQFDDPSFLKKTQHLQQDNALESASSPDQPGPDANTYNVNGYDFLMHNAQHSSAAAFTSDSPFSDESADLADRHVSAPHTVSEPFRHDSHSQHCQDQFDNSQNSLSAYHNALAEAAQKAADDGRFTRQTSTATSNSTFSQDQGRDHEEPAHQPEQVTQTHANYGHNGGPSYSGFDFDFQGRTAGHSNNSSLLTGPLPQLIMPSNDFGYQSFPQDDDDDSYDFDDADLIAAANAEALSADDSGMYGQEFGFYARPRPGSAEGERDTNGGYFGQPGIEIQRQKSLREPNLTPITERSEFSTRNSFIQGPGGMPGMGRPWSPMSIPGSAQGLPSPALSSTMLARMSPLTRPQLLEDENMTLAEIRKGLHANAFAGSIGSLNSDYSRGVPSPIAEYGPAGLPYSPNHPHPSAPAGYFMPVPRGATQNAVATGGVPMAWQRSTESNPSHYSHSHSSSLADIPSSPSPMGPPSTSPQATQAQAFSFFDGGDIDAEAATSSANNDFSSSNMATPKKATLSPYMAADAPPTPSTARKAPPTSITTPGYMGAAKPALGSPLKEANYAPPPNYLTSPSFASFAASTSPTNTAANTTANTASVSADATGNSSPLMSPRSAGGFGAHGVGHKRVGSGADSINYVKERDENGAKRWVLERRRTSEFGLQELIGREIIEGGI